MPNLQQAELLEFVAPATLKPHPLNVAIYGEDGYQDLVESIKELGVLQALYVTSKNTILSGHRRWRAAMAAECPVVPIIRMDYTDELDERQAIIEHNRYRIKTGLQLWREGQELDKIGEEKGRQNKAHGLTAPGRTLLDKSPKALPHNTREIVATTIGLGSGRQWDRLQEVAQKAPELLPQIKPHGLSIGGAYSQVKKQERKAKVEAQKEAIKNLAPLAARVWDVIVIDPPWPMAGEYDPAGRRGIPPYPTLTPDELASIVIPATDNSILWLWVINTRIHDGFHLLEHWGFQYRNMLTWAKDKFGLGDWLRGQTEHCLLATKGKPLFTGESTSTLLNAPRTEHSTKPDAFYELVEKTCVGRKLDYFGRKQREGWDVYGDEA